MRTAQILTTLLLYATCAWAGANEERNDDHSQSSVEQMRLTEMIAVIESNEGAYAAALTEPLLSLGTLLQRRGRHEEAIGLFKRGVHLARVNGGLNNPDQIPLLKAAIKSHIAQRDYELADKRQRYLYRLQSKNLESGYALTVAYMQQAQWQFDAFLLQLDDQGFVRLLNMADLYARARDEVIIHSGESSRNLLQPLLGLLQTQYLIAGYSGSTHGTDSSQYYSFVFHKRRVDDEVRAIITQLAQIDRPGLSADEWRAETGVMLGDWLMWSGQRISAMNTYQASAAELDAASVAQEDTEEGLLDQPVALPALGGVRLLPDEAGQGAQNHVQLSFDVTANGRVVNLQRLDENEALDGKASRLMRKLRRTPFRPRFEAGMPVETENLVKYYVVNT